MSFANRFNKGKKFDVDTSELGFVTLGELYEKNGENRQYLLTAIFINNKSKYGPSPVFATPEFLVNIPQHMLDTVNEILLDSDAVDSINSAKVGFTIYQYNSDKFNTVAYGVKFVDLIKA